jgi:hypothetical protein
MARYKSYDPESPDKFRISRSKVDLFLNCARCFYLDVRLGVKRPAGFPFNLNSAVDALLKKEFDTYRVEGKPHPYMIEYGINAIPYTHPDLETWRSNFKGVSFYDETTNFEAFGAVDDLWIDNQTKEIIVVDYKATSKAEEVTLDADWQIGYKRQMEFYQWLLRNNGLEVSKQGWFVYCNGIKDKAGFYNNLEFSIKLIPYVGDSSWVTPTMDRIKDCLDSAEVPTNALECPYCKYALEYQIYNK